MAASSMISSPAFSPAAQLPRHSPVVSPSSLSFHGLRPLTTKANPLCTQKRTSAARGGLVVKAELNPSVVISLSTGLSLFLGRFVFFNFQRENVAKQGLPEQNGMTHFEAGDTRAKEYVSLLKSNDPVGFNIVDVLAWGSIGHIVAYYILATTSNGYDPKFFG
ncbi:photosystem I reaction center subunit V, chloroplastic [Neltuma alba]|uniref:photosystem I reaction center subunit V, chloroplastic n=1 Tax=Neltuma alba TaxID=207710 RepID=UPI0010A3B318|nr:photosystem I reaction center subunit V, chloroplastic [Prosopis alba]